jgi:hypothetical protein
MLTLLILICVRIAIGRVVVRIRVMTDWSDLALPKSFAEIDRRERQYYWRLFWWAAAMELAGFLIIWNVGSQNWPAMTLAETPREKLYYWAALMATVTLGISCLAPLLADARSGGEADNLPTLDAPS